MLNGANEAAVALFLQDQIGFLEIPQLVSAARAVVPVKQNPVLEDILEADCLAREAVHIKYHEG